MKISLDFDGVLANTMQAFLDKWNHDHHSTVFYNDISNWNFNENLGISRNAFYDYLKQVWSDWGSLKPLESNLNLQVSQLRLLNQVDIVTSVLPTHIQYVEKWLKKWGIGYDKIVSTDDKISLDYDLYIDDRPGLFTELENYHIRFRENAKTGILYHQPWNSKCGGWYKRAYNWNDIVTLVSNKNEY